MKKFIIERSIPGAGQLTPSELAEITKKSLAASRELNKDYHWIQSYVTDDKIFCVHIAPDRETILNHSALGCFPADQVYEVRAIFDPSNA